MTSLGTRVFTDANQKVVAYDDSPVQWRVSAYALIVQDQSLFLIKNRTEQLYDIVGGGLDLGETIEEALQREALEEAGAAIAIGQLLHASTDWFYHKSGQYYQTVQLFYTASLVDRLEKPTDPDIEWTNFVPFAKLSEYPLPPIVEQVVGKYLA